MPIRQIAMAADAETAYPAIGPIATVAIGQPWTLFTKRSSKLLVAADIIRTVALAPTMPNLLILAVLVVVRTFLSWSLVEMEGHWPWKS